MFIHSSHIYFDGWIKKQLEAQVNGLFGSLDKIWKDVKDSKWLGGNEEGWERFPYYLGGLIPIAYALKDGELIKKANKYIDVIISCQREDGRICPLNDTEALSSDIWSIFLVLKVLAIYGDCSGDGKVDEVILKGLKYVYNLMNYSPIINWAHARYFECFISMVYLKRKTSKYNKFLKELAHKLKSQGLDYKSCSYYWDKPKKVWSYDMHGVNIAMALKANILYKELTGVDDGFNAKEMINILDKYHGNAYGFFNCDECLSGLSPNGGAEVCAVVEAMYSYEVLFDLTNDKFYIERLERLAFNGLAATITTDMWAHQYDQQVNQLNCATHDKNQYFTTNGRESTVFGLEPNYGCCTANFGQGWPLFALSSFSCFGDSVQINIPLSATITLDNGLVLEVRSQYPFRKEVSLKANKDTTVRIRVSSYAKIAGFKNRNYINVNLKKDEEVKLNYLYELNLNLLDNNFATLHYGPLLFSLPIKYKERIVEYERNNVERKYPYCDYHYTLDGEWRYGFNSTLFFVKENEYDLPFDRNNPPLFIEGSFSLLDWRFKRNYQNIPQEHYNSVIRDDLILQLQPYGATYLRMTEMPFIEK